MKFNKKLWVAAFTLTGTIIGAGILGLPYVFAKAGFLAGLFWLIFLGGIMTYLNLIIGEISLRTKSHHQLSGYAEKYLGKKGKNIMFFAMLFGVYSALLAYLIGEGESLSKILPGSTNPILLGFLFWLSLTILLRDGLKGIKKIETYGVLIIAVIIIGLFIKLIPKIKFSNLLIFNSVNFTAPFGVILFALMGFMAIPELKKEVKGDGKLLKKAIIVGGSIPIVLYIIFSAIFIGVLGKNINQVATLSLGPFITLLGIFTMLTSYIVLSYSLKDTLERDIKIPKKINLFLTSLIPLIIYILVSKFHLAGFASILGFGGVISGGVTGILILLMKQKADKTYQKNLEIRMPINKWIIIILSLIFSAGILFEFL